MTDAIDPLRHLEYFDPIVWGDRRIDIIGLGATGSWLAQLIARLGVGNLHLHDDDIIASHNIANQAYPITHYMDLPKSEPDDAISMSGIGRGKAETCRDLIRAATSIEPTIHGKCEGAAASIEEELGDVVFLCVDSMAARASIFAERLRMRTSTQLVIDLRMGVEEFRLYSFCPFQLQSFRQWEATITPDEETVENACQTRTTLGGTAAIVAGLAKTWFLQWYRQEIVGDRKYDTLPFELVMMLRPPLITTR